MQAVEPEFPRAVFPSRILLALLASTLLAPEANAQNHLYTFDGGEPNVLFGSSVGGAGDVNQDGYADVVVGAPSLGKNGRNSGRVRVLSGRDGKLLYTFNGDSAGDLFGFSVDGAGDVNNDGYADIVVGAPSNGKNGKDSGSARVLSGKDGKVLYTFYGDSAWDFFGFSVSGAGDVNKDGYADIVVGAPLDDNNTRDSGSARVLSGKDGKILYTFNGDNGLDCFGCSVSGAGDVNRDGHADIVVGATQGNAQRWRQRRGYARVFSGRDAKILYNFSGDSAFDSFGGSVSGVGDVDKDGYADIVVGAPYDDNNNRTDSGSARVLSGKDGKVLFTIDGASAGDGFGWSVSEAGDVNQDAVPDLVVGAPFASYGGALVLSGKDGKVLYSFKGDAVFDRFGLSVAGAGDVNGDGLADIVVGAPYDDNNGGASGSARVLSGAKLALTADTHFVSLSKGGKQGFLLGAGSAHGGKFYLLLGSMSGTKPGLKLGPITLPLNPDLYFGFTLGSPNTLIVNSLGRLDASGRSTVRLELPPGLAPGLAGSLLHHAYLVFRTNPLSFDLASNPRPLTLVK